MQIELKKLVLTNFKGASSMEIIFSDETKILGENASGKTTVYDAFRWLLYGKDSSDRKDFEIKTIINGNVIPQIDHEVYGEFVVNGISVSLKRILREKWTKKRGSAEATFDGNETLYYYNELPLSQGEYQKKISEICQEDLFKLLTDPSYFNSLPWKEKRSILQTLAGEINNEEIYEGMSGKICSFSQSGKPMLIELLSKGTIEENKKRIGSQKKKIKDDLDQIPTRIDEAQRGMPSVKDWQQLESSKSAYENDITVIDEQLSNSTESFRKKNAHNESLQEQILELEKQKNKFRSDMLFAIENDYSKLQNQIKIMTAEKETIQRRIDSARNELKTLPDRKIAVENLLNKERDEWNKLNSSTIEFNEQDFSCPTCKTPFKESEIAVKKSELETNFNQHKELKLADSEAKGVKLKAELQELSDRESELTTTIERATEELQEYKDMPVLFSKEEKIAEFDRDINDTCSSIVMQIESHISELSNDSIEAQPMHAELMEKKKMIEEQIRSIERDLLTKETIDTIEKRKETLLQQQRELAKSLADLEQSEYLLEMYSLAESELLEEKINAHFFRVKFRLFNQLINGGLEDACVCLIGGVPYPDANNAAKINAGLDIINTLSEKYNTYAPCFIDNAESVIEFIDTKTQIIYLIVSPEKLRYEHRATKVPALV